MKKNALLSSLLLIVCLLANSAYASIVYVTPVGAGTKDGSSWANALDGNTVANVYYTKLRQVIYDAPAGTVFWIAKGTYRPMAATAVTDSIAFRMKNPVKLYGGFAGTEVIPSQRTGTNATIFDGATSNSSVWCKYLIRFDSPLNVRLAVSNSVAIDGFTFSNVAQAISIFGGYNQSTITNNVFSALKKVETNPRYYLGGAISVTNSFPTIENNTISNSDLEKAIDVNIEAWSVTPEYIYVKIQNNSIKNNSTGVGYGIYVSSQNPLTKFYIAKNNLYNLYAGVCVSFTSVNLQTDICQNTISNNQYGLILSALSQSTSVYNNIITHNNTGMQLDRSPVKMVYNTVCKNVTGIKSGMPNGSNQFIYNSIFYYNTKDFESTGYTNYFWCYNSFATENAVAPMYVYLNSCINTTSPSFANPPTAATGIVSNTSAEAENWKISPLSPAINSGYSDFTGSESDLGTIESDYAGNARIVSGIPDMGAYEYSLPIVYVTTTGKGTKNGTSWANALDGATFNANGISKLNERILNAPQNTTFFIAWGTYEASNKKLVNQSEIDSNSFNIRKDVELYGGFNGNETTARERSITMSKTVLKAPYALYAVRCYNDLEVNPLFVEGLVIDGFEMNGAQTGLLLYGVNAKVFRCAFKNCTYGLSYGNTLHKSILTLANCEFTGCRTGLLVLKNNTNKAVFADHNIFSKNETGIEIISDITNSDFPDDRLSYNTIYACSNGLYFRNFNGNVFATIIWNCTSAIVSLNSKTSYSYCMVEGATSDGYRNIVNNSNGTFWRDFVDGDPLFEDAEQGDFRLKSCSPAVNPKFLLRNFWCLPVDILGTTPNDVVDIGAIEYFDIYPSTPASNIWTSAQTNSSVQLHWTKGSGCERIVLVSEAGVPYYPPMPQYYDEFGYNSNFGTQGTQYMSVFNIQSKNDTLMWSCVYRGDGDQVTVNKLKAGKTYYVKVLESTPNGYYQYSDAIGNYVVVTMPKLKQTITFASIPSQVYAPNKTVTLSATASLGLPLTFISDNLSVATVSGKTVTIKSAGSANITAYYKGNDSVDSAGVVIPLVVSKAPQTITFAALAAKTYGDASFALSATATSGLAVTFTSSNPNVAIVSQGKVLILAAGTTQIIPYQAGDNNYLPVEGTAQTLTVAQAAQSLTMDSILAKKYGDAEFKPLVTSNTTNPIFFSSSNTAVAKVVDGKVYIVGVGKTTITATQDATNDYKAATAVKRVLLVDKTTQSISFATIDSKTFGDADFSLVASSTSLLPVTYISSDPAILSIAEGVASIKGAGTVTITAKQAGNDNYLAAPDVKQIITIGKSAQTITLAATQSKTYGDASFSLPATASSGLTISYTSDNASVISVSGNIASIVGAGTAVITATQTGDANYTAATTVKQTITVGKASQSISLAATQSKTYGDASFSLPATASSGLTISYTSDNASVISVSGNIASIVGAGTAVITATQTGDANYTAATTVKQTITVGKASQSISLAATQSKTYGDASFSLPLTASSGLVISYKSDKPNVISVSGNIATVVGVGTAIITASQTGDANYLAATDVKQTIVVSQASQTISFGALDKKTFGDADFALPATSSAGLAISYSSDKPAVVSIAGNIVTINGVGTATITATQAGNANVKAATTVVQSIEIVKAAQSITFVKPVDKTFGDADFLLAAKASSGLAVSYVLSNDSVLSVAGNIAHILGEGSCTIKAVQSGNDNYSTSDTVTYTIKVSRKSQTISMKAFATVAYDTTLRIVPQVSCESNAQVTFTSSNTAVAKLVDNRIQIVGVGNATITAIQSGAKNYLPAQTETVLKVVKAPQTISFILPAQTTFGAIAPKLEASASSGLAVAYTSTNESVAKVVNGVLNIVGTGKTIITATQGGDNNYEAAISVPRELTVTKATQNITFAALPSFTYRDTTIVPQLSTGSGLSIALSSDNASVAVIKDGKIVVVGAGTARITASQDGNANYWAAAQVTQVLVIDRLEQSITLTAPSTAVYGQAAIDLKASANSGLELIYATSNSKVAKVENGKLEIIGVGTATITVSTIANDNFKTTQTAFTVVVSKAPQTISFAPIANRSIADGDVFPVVKASSGLKVNLKSSNDAIAKEEKGIIKILATGTVTITASVAESDNYFAAKDSSVTFTVLKTTQSIVFTTLPNLVYGDTKTLTLDGFTSSKLPITYTSSNPKVASVKDNIVTILSVGNAIITASQAGDGNYEAAGDKQQVLTVLKMSQHIDTITAFVDTVKFEAQLLTVRDTSNRGLKLEYQSSNESVAVITQEGKVHIVGAGTTIISAHQNGNDTVDAAKVVEHRLVVSQQIQSITVLSNASVVYGSNDFDLVISGNKAKVNLQSQTPNLVQIVNGKVHVVGVGAAQIRITQDAVAGYKAIDTTIAITVEKAKDSVYFKPLANKLLGQQSFRLFASSKSGQAVSYRSSNPAVASVTENEVTINGAGTCIITASVDESDNYFASATAQSFTVSAMDVLKLPAYTVLRDTLIDLNALRLNADEFTYSFVPTTHDKLTASINNSQATIVPNRSVACWTGIDTLWFKAANKTSKTDSVVFGVKVTRNRFADHIGLVTTDSLTGTYNIVAWEPKQLAATKAWTVYRRGESLLQWDSLGQVAATDTAVFVDKAVNTKQQAYQYAIVTKDEYGCKSPMSAAHTTMHLKTGVSLQNYPQLWWSAYQGVEVESYIIYRENVQTKQFEEIGSTFLTSFTDLKPNGTNNYRVAIKFANWVKPSKLKSDTGPFSQSLSNMSEASLVDVALVDAAVEVVAWPNPATEVLNVKLADNNGATINLFAANGSLVAQTTIANNAAQFDVSRLASGLYSLQVQTDKKAISQSVTISK